MLGLIGSAIGGGTYAIFTASTSTSANAISTANLAITNDHTATTVVSLTNMVPGDTIAGLVQVTNSGSEDLALYSVATTASAATVLTTDQVNGLRLWVERCTVAWTGVGNAASCSGTRIDLIGTNGTPYTTWVPLTTVAGLTNSFSMISVPNAFCTNAAGMAAERTARGVVCDTTVDLVNARDALKVHVGLGINAGNPFENLSVTVTFTFSGQSPPAHAF